MYVVFEQAGLPSVGSDSNWDPERYEGLGGLMTTYDDGQPQVINSDYDFARPGTVNRAFAPDPFQTGLELDDNWQEGLSEQNGMDIMY